MPLARRNLFQNPLRFLLSAAVVALSIMLMLVLNGFLSGVDQQARAYLDRVPGSLVVTPPEVTNFMGQSTLLPAGAYEKASQVAGVGRVVPVLDQVFIVDLGGTKTALFVLGYDPALGGGPWQLKQGRLPQAENEIVLDYALAQQRDIVIGDKLQVGGREFAISGLSGGTNTWVGAYLFMPKQVLEKLVLAPGASSYLFVTPAAGMAAEELRDPLSSATGGTAMLKDELVERDSRLLKGIYGPPLQLMIGIAFLVGTLVMGLVIFTATAERQREYGVLKAIGARNSLLYQVVAGQAVISAGAGLVVGIVLSFGVAWLITELRPAITIAIEPGGVVLDLTAGLVMALLAALFPARNVAQLAPAEVFRR